MCSLCRAASNTATALVEEVTEQVITGTMDEADDAKSHGRLPDVSLLKGKLARSRDEDDDVGAHTCVAYGGEGKRGVVHSMLAQLHALDLHTICICFVSVCVGPFVSLRVDCDVCFLPAVGII